MDTLPKSFFKNKTLLITGGTGSFGNTFLENFIHSEIKEIRIFSRDEKKQDDMRKKFQNSKIKFYIGDIRDYKALFNALKGVNFVFHAAALKQVPSCEFFPIEAVKTNILGTENLLDASINRGVEKVICLSTDKAVYPINSMGLSKALMEKISIAKSRNTKETIIAITRFGNVMASRGSVIPLFFNQILNNKPITITNPKMTRFIMDLNEAVNLVMYAFVNGKPGDIYVQKSPSTTIENLSQAILEILNAKPNMKKYIGTRVGEKLYEVLISREEMAFAIDKGNYYLIPPNHEKKDYGDYVEQGNLSLNQNIEYTSENTTFLEIKDLKPLIKNLDIYKEKNNLNFEKIY